MNNICVISDCHLGYRHRLKYQRLEDYENAFKEAVEKALKFQPKILIFLGDLFHYARPDPRSMHLVMRTLMNMANSCKVVLCIGNHEIEGSLKTAYLPIFSELHENIQILTTESPHVTLQIENKKIGIHGFEFIRNKKDAEGILDKIAGEASFENDINILCIHQALQGYLDPYELSLPAVKTFAKKFNLILFGHVHKHQVVKEIFPITPTFYVGSTERISFNESNNKTGFLVFKEFNFKTPEFIPVSSAKMRRFRENLGEKTPEEINTYIKKKIEENKDVNCLQIVIDVKIKGDYMDIMHDWEAIFDEFTILDVVINPKISESKFKMEKLELNENLIEEYFEKTGMKDKKELKELCLKLYEKYGG